MNKPKQIIIMRKDLNMREIMTLMFAEARANDSESNDSTLYWWMLKEFNEGSKVLPDVAEVLRMLDVD